MSKAKRRDTHKKCSDILACIVNQVNTVESEKFAYQHGASVGFRHDFGDNTLTIYVNGNHTHVGTPGGTFEELIDQLHNLLINGKGLSWA
jgi:hypothetical protein